MLLFRAQFVIVFFAKPNPARHGGGKKTGSAIFIWQGFVVANV
jgi:hypothetical protein